MTRALLIVCCLCAAAPAPAAVVEAPADDVRVLVLDLEGAEVPADRRASIVGLIAARLAQNPRLDVVAGADLRRLADLEADRQRMGCDQTSCLAEIADAMGADLVVFGDVAQLGATLVLNLNMFDSKRARSVGRTSVRGADLGELAARVDVAVDELARPTLAERGIAPSAPPPAASTTADAGGGVWLGVVAPAALVVVGVVVAAGGLAFDLSSPTSADGTLDGGDFVGPTLMAAGVAGIAAGAGLALAVGAGGDDG